MQSSVQRHVIEQMQRVADARHHDPFSILGYHKKAEGAVVRCFKPKAKSVSLVTKDGPIEMEASPFDDFFSLEISAGTTGLPMKLLWEDNLGTQHSEWDPYSFAPTIGDTDIHLFAEGKHWHIYNILGAHMCTHQGVDGVKFATWAPNAERVSVVGDFNHWDGRVHQMRSRGASGLWEIFIPDLKPGDLYKFEIRSAATDQVFIKTDPYGRSFEHRPATSSKITAVECYQWQDQNWMDTRKDWQWNHSPMSVYEIHLGSWKRGPNGDFLNYRDIAHQLAEYLQHLHYTHVELLPVSEHPLDDSWGYQTTGYYAPTSRFGSPEDFKYFVEHMHRNNIGVLVDWVPAHFPKDEHALARFDGTPLYEHEDPRIGEHKDWGTLVYNFARNEVRNFLIANALFWLKEYHIDGLRVDAVAAMLHLDYSREDGEWVPNIHGGNENLEAVEFVKELNIQCHGQCPGAVVIAEESTAWPQVSGPTWLGGLGFTLKWNMGWMHDTLQYIAKDPIHRKFHHELLTFGLVYAFSENFQLPFSHDEVVYGKGSMLQKMPGDNWQKFANLRLLYTYMMTYPGSKLLFMGSEFGQFNEWNHNAQLNWHLLDYAPHRGIFDCVKDLNRLYRDTPALYENSYSPDGFEWIDCHDHEQSVISYIRRTHADGGENGEAKFLMIVLNFTPEPRDDYCITVPFDGHYRVIFNSDSSFYGGSNSGNEYKLPTFRSDQRDGALTLSLSLPPLAGIILEKI